MIFLVFFFKSPKSVKQAAGVKAQLLEMDLPGTFLFLPTIVCLLLALHWGGSTYSWGNGRIIALFVVFGVLLICFGLIQVWQQDKATLPPRLLKNRNVAGASWYALSFTAAFFVMTYYVSSSYVSTLQNYADSNPKLPIWFQAIKGVSATKSGIMNLPAIVGLSLFSIVSGGLVSVVGYYTPFMLAATTLATVGIGLLTTLEPDSGPGKWIGYQAMFGIGAGLGFQQALTTVQASLPAVDVPHATAIITFAQSLGGAIFISVGENVFSNQLIRNLEADAPSVNAAEIFKAGATMLRRVVPEDMLSVVLNSYNKAVTETFYVAVAMCGLSLFGALVLEWRSVKGRSMEMAAV